MQRIALDLEAVASLERFTGFLENVREDAGEAGHSKLVSITLQVSHLDPLAVLDSIYEPGESHGYFEHPGQSWALAGAEAVWEVEEEGPGRFTRLRDALLDWNDHTILIGDADLPEAGPHFICSVPFAESGATAHLFLPLWQVARWESRYLAVANCVVQPDRPVDSMASRIWQAHETFKQFDYAETPLREHPELRQRIEVGGEDSYEERVRRGLAGIREGQYGKIVLSRAQDLVFDRDLLPLQVLTRLRDRFRNCTGFSLQWPSGYRFLGSTPERLLRVRNGVLETEAIAGSIRRGASVAEDARLAGELLESGKDRREHDHVVASTGRRLATAGVYFPEPGPPELITLPNVHHLRTPLRSAIPEERHVLDLAAALHPTPATGGTPRGPAMDDIERLEPFERGLFAGLGGWVNLDGDGEFLVLLRCAEIEGPRARLFAGAGIVEGSDPGKEYAETEVKMRALREAILTRGR